MKKTIVTLFIFLALARPVLGETPSQELQMLILSEIEERIAGRLAFNTLKQKLTEKGFLVTTDQRVSAIGQAVAKYSDRAHLHFSFYMIEGQLEPQAISLPGGYVLLSQTLIELFCSTDDELAFVLGHEISHSALRHYADYKLRDDQQVAYVKHLLQQYGLFEQRETSETIEELQGILFPYIMKIRQIKEIEADQFGALYALRAGYEFSAGIQVLQKLRTVFGDHYELEHDIFPEYSDAPPVPSTHPTLTDRIEQLRLFRIKAIEVAKLFPLGRKALDEGNYEEASLIFETILSLFPQSRTAQIGLGVAYHLRYWDSTQSDDFLLAYPGSLELEHLQLLRGMPDFQTLQQAVAQYRSVLSVEPGNAFAANNLGVALGELNQFADAERVLREALQLGERDFILFNLALLLYHQYRQTQQPEVKQEAIALMKRYLQITPYDQVAKDYLKTLE